MQRLGIATKLALLGAAATAVVVFAAFALLSVRVRDATRNRFAEQVAAEQRTFLSIVRDVGRQLVVSAGVAAESPGLRSAIATYRVESNATGVARDDLTSTVQRELQRIATDLGHNFAAATDDQGRVFASYVADGAPPPAASNYAAMPAIRRALDGGSPPEADSLIAVLALHSSYYHIGVVPIVLDGFTIGTVMLGNRLGRESLGAMRESFGGDAALAVGRTVIAATSQAVAEIARDGVPSDGDMRTIGGETYVAGSSEVGQTQVGMPVRLTLLRPVSPAVRSLTDALRRDFIVFGALAVLLAALGAALLARSLLRPLRQFVEFLRAGAPGGEVAAGAQQRMNVSPETQTLHESFTTLMSSLSQQRDLLEQRSIELAKSNEVLRDEIRERERIEGALRTSEEQLRQSQKLEAVGQLAGGIAHDFNNLLTVIGGFTELAALRVEKDSEAAADLREARDATTRAGKLTHQLLAFSRKQVLQPRVIDLNTVLDSIVPMLRRLIGAHITLELEQGEDIPRILADPGQLEQVIVNLAVNARDAMPRGGTLKIRSAADSDEEGGVCLMVSDTGMGMSPAVRERMFEPFFTTKEAGHGTGLGLATVYGIVKQTGGSIKVESEEGVGTTFTIALPTAADSDRSEPVDPKDGKLPKGNERILLVEDEDHVRLLAHRVLASCGYQIVAMRDGAQALAWLRSGETCDAVVTDVVMPQLNGAQLAQEIAKLEIQPAIVFMSGYTDDALSKFEMAPEQVLLRKPFTPFALARALRDALDNARVAR